jgi:uncharacterized protein YndB with AHSA1/START domain
MRVGGLEVTTPGEREIVLRREFDAPRNLVFDAFTKPELVQRWMLGPPGHEMPVCEIDARPGGAYRYVWRDVAAATEMTSYGAFREVIAPERIVHTERFEMSGMDNPTDMGDESVVTTTFTERGGRTTVTMTCRYPSREIRDGVLASGMANGVEASYARLDEMLRTLA